MWVALTVAASDGDGGDSERARTSQAAEEVNKPLFLFCQVPKKVRWSVIWLDIENQRVQSQLQLFVEFTCDQIVFIVWMYF